MAITIIEILGTDNVGASRTTINQNFSALKLGVEDLEGYIDSGANVIKLTDGALVPVDTIVFAGATGLMTANGLNITTALGIVNSGAMTIGGVSQINNTLTVTGATALQNGLTLTGNLATSGSLVLNGIGSVDVFTDNVFQSSGGSGLIPSDNYYHALDFSNSAIDGVQDLLILEAGILGQKIILSLEGKTAGTGAGFIDTQSLDNQPIIQHGGSIGNKIELTELYANVELYYNGVYWILIGGHGYSIV